MNRRDFVRTATVFGAAYNLAGAALQESGDKGKPSQRTPPPVKTAIEPNVRPRADQVNCDIADYVMGGGSISAEAYVTAHHCLIDTIGCGMAALSFPACTKLLGPLVPGTIVPNGAKVPGTSFQLDPVEAAFHLGTLNRWLDYNDAWLAAEWGHPSDNLGAILAVGDWLSRTATAAGRPPLLMHDLLTALIKAYEIQGILSNLNSLNRVGLDHVLLVKVASTAAVAHMLGLPREQIINALSHAWCDGGPLRTFRHSPNVGSRKSWAAGDAAARAVRLALIARTGEMGIPSVLSAKDWGFYDVLFKGKTFEFDRPYGCYVMENILFKVSYPSGFHIQSAVECAVKLHAPVEGRLDQIKQITIRTHESTMRYLVKKGPLNNPADRDHCVQYAVAIGLLKGDLVAGDYEDDVARDPRIDPLREKMVCVEDPAFTKAYFDPERHANPNAIRIEFTDGAALPEVVVEYPIGHRRRRQEGVPLLKEKYRQNLDGRFPPAQRDKILALSFDPTRVAAMPVHEFVDAFVT